MSSTSLPPISFGIIVFNGEPFVRYNLRALYPFAHEIIVVEGACRDSASLATACGHSTDGTLEELRRFQTEEDPGKKLHIITKDEFWSEKDEQSQAYARRATGDYLWQVDIDEFYKPEDMQNVIKMIQENPEIAAVSFHQITFWGGFNLTTDSWYLRNGASEYHRLFRWKPGYEYHTHRPPTVLDEMGRDLRTQKWIRAKDLASREIFLYHYSLVFPKQVEEKCTYHAQRQPSRYADGLQWTKEVYLGLKRPYRVHNVWTYPSWLQRYTGTHPPQISKMRADIESGKVSIKLRHTNDAEKLVDSVKYRAGRACLKLLFPVFQTLQPLWPVFVFVVNHPMKAIQGVKRRIVRLVHNSS